MLWKVVNRITYALVIALGFMAVYALTDLSYRSVELRSLTETALAENNETFFISVRYYNEEPLYEEMIEIQESFYRIVFYETAYITVENDAHVVSDGFVVFLFKESGTTSLTPFTVSFYSEDDALITYEGYQFFDYPIYTIEHPQTKAKQISWVKLKVEDQAVDTITKMTIMQGETLLGEVSLSLEQTDFQLKTHLESYLQANNVLPSESTETFSVQEPIVILTGGYVLRNGVIYIIFVFLLTYFFYRYRNNRLGRKQPTEGLQKDLAKIRNPKE